MLLANFRNRPPLLLFISLHGTFRETLHHLCSPAIVIQTGILYAKMHQ